MAFPTDWGRKCELVFQSGQVAETHSNYPALVTKDNLPDEMFDADGSYPALNGGGDIRFSSDTDGNTQLPCEIEQFVTDNNPVNGKAAIWVKVASLASASNTSIWIWYNKAGESQPAEDATYGKEAVWDSNFVMVQHMNQDPSGSSPQMIDSTSNDSDGTSYGTMLSGDLVDAQIGKGLDFDENDDYVATSIYPDPRNPSTVSFWVNFDDVTPLQESTLGSHDGTNRYYFGIDTSNNLFVAAGNNYIGVDTGLVNSGFSAGNFGLFAIRITGSNVYIYVDGAYKATFAYSASAASTRTFFIGARNHAANTTPIGGLIDEVRISNTARSAGWCETEYNNQKTPSTFIIEGTPETPGAPPPEGAPTAIFYGPLVGMFGGPI